MRILITGSSGFVGSATKKELIKRGHDIIDFDLPEHDLMNKADLKASAIDADLIIHSAAQADLYKMADDPFDGFNLNVYGSYNVMRVAKELDIKLIYISTCCVYGDAHKENGIVYESTYPKPIEFYARTKFAAEPIIQEHEKHVICRLGTVYGEGMRPALFNWIILNAAKNDEQFVINGDGSHSRQYIYIEDLAKAISQTVERFPQGEILNLCGKDEINLNLVVETAKKVTEKELKYTHGPVREMGDVSEVISIDKTCELIDWQPEINYYEGMDKTWKWLNQS